MNLQNAINLATGAKLAATLAMGVGINTSAFGQITIDNDLNPSEVGYLSVTITPGGDSRNANITGTSAETNSPVSANFLFDYGAYVNIGNGAFRLADTAAGSVALNGDDSVVSSGSFTGSNGNAINWTVTSQIPNGETRLDSSIMFSSSTGTLGNLTFYQYIDQDILGISDDVLFTQGSVAQNNLEVFTLDGASLIGVSQSGSYTASQGLANASFIGWAADNYNDIVPNLTSNAQAVSLTGVIDTTALPQIQNETLNSTVRGEADVVSVMGWRVDAQSTNAAINTALDGITDGGGVPLPEPGNFEQTVLPGDIVEQSLYVEDENGTPLAVTLLNLASIIGEDGSRYRGNYSTISRVWSWDTTGIPEGEYVLSFNIRNAQGQFDNGSLTVNIVPEPASFVLLGFAGLALVSRRRRRNG